MWTTRGVRGTRVGRSRYSCSAYSGRHRSPLANRSDEPIAKDTGAADQRQLLPAAGSVQVGDNLVRGQKLRGGGLTGLRLLATASASPNKRRGSLPPPPRTIRVTS